MMNKKIYAILIAVVFTTGVAQAQFSFGVRGGFNLTNMTKKIDLGIGGMTLEPNFSFKPGFQAGIVGELAITDALAIQPGILFATQGARWNETLLEEEFDVTFSFNYLQVPINVQFGIPFGNNLRFLLQAGPYVGFALNGSMSASESGMTVSDDLEFGEDGEWRRLDFGLGFGAGVEIGNIQIAAGYNLGLANISSIDELTASHNGFALTVTYLFRRR